jgi:plasmid stabilization system protein ParE
MVLWSKRALLDLDRLHGWLSELPDAQPDRAILRIRSAAMKLETLGDIGRPGPTPDTRELSVRSAPYVIVYRFAGDDFEIMAVFHTAQSR